MRFFSFNRLLKAVIYSWDGLLAAAKEDKAFQLELLIALILTPIACVLNISLVAKLMLIGSLIFVLIVELLNTAVETLADRVSTELHPLVKKAKDVASAAVLLAVLLATLMWATVLLS